jgi:mediator of RNA polymerase II transcription subunit 6
VKPLAAYFIVHNRIYQSPDVYSILSNRLVRNVSTSSMRLAHSVLHQLAAVHSLQASLNILRKHRPDYTPRTGFVWPIADPNLHDDASKTRKQDSEATAPEQDGLDPDTNKSSQNPKKEQNTALLFNAMRATAAHSRLSYTPITAEAADTGAATATPALTQQRSSVTPAPGSQETLTKGAAATTSRPQEPPKGPPGGGKKKRKRMCAIRSCMTFFLMLGLGTSLAAPPVLT